MYVMRLEAYGNLDHGENPFVKVCKSKRVCSESIEVLQDAMRKYIDDNDLSAGNISMVNVFDKETKEFVGQISYNGRFWKDGYRGGVK